MQADSDLQDLLDRAYLKYMDDLDGIAEAAAYQMELMIERGLDYRDAVKDFVDMASETSIKYYNALREAWQQAGAKLPSYVADQLIDIDQVLWTVRKGWSNTDYNGVTFQQTLTGNNKYGLTINQMWPDFHGNVDDAQQFIADMVHASARLTQANAIKADPSNPRWARVPSGQVTCAFCLMLASRGFAYTSEETAGRSMQYHDHCDCKIVPSWGKQTLTGYNPDKYLYMWQQAKAATTGTYRDVLKTLRRQYPDLVTDGVYNEEALAKTLATRLGWTGQWYPPSKTTLAKLSDFSKAYPTAKYTPEEKEAALKRWTGGAYADINGALSGKIKNPKRWVETAIDKMDEAMDEHKTTSWFTVDRLAPLSTFDLESAKDAFKLKIGDSFGHDCFAACSTVQGGIKASDGEKILVRFLVPKDTKAVYLKKISNYGHENEVLLGRGFDMEIVKVGTQNGQPIVFVEVI